MDGDRGRGDRLSPAWVEVADGVRVRTSRRMATTTTFIEGPGVLVDPAWTADELDAIAREVGSVRAGFCTHAHHDHLLWHPDLGDVRRWATPRTAELAATERVGLLEMLGDGYSEEVLGLFGQVTALAGETVPGTDLVAIAHDGHAPGHAALFDPASRVLVAGDMLSEVELPLPFWPDDLLAYLAGLDALAPWVARAAVLVPGHGTPSYAPLERLDADRSYLDDVLAGRAPDDPRLGNEGMAEMHARLVALVRGAE